MVTAFIEDVLRLLRRADPHAAEERKIQFLLREIKEETFNTIIRDPPLTASDFVIIAIRLGRATS